MTSFRVAAFAFVTLLSGADVLLAQSGLATATLVKIEGVVYLNDQRVAEAAAPIALGEVGRIRTDEGRAVVSLKRGGALVLAGHASVGVSANNVYNFNKIELLAGSAVVVSAESSPLVACGTDVRLSSAGVFRFDVDVPERVDGSQRCGFRVYEGAGTTPGATVAYVLRAGQRMTLSRRAGDMIPVTEFSPAELDEFDRWSRQAARTQDRLPALPDPTARFDPARDADRDIKAAVAEAKRTGKRVILDVGGEWCSWCHTLDRYFADHPELRAYRDAHYVWLKINMSPENENRTVLARYPHINGYPHLFVLDQDGKLLQSQDTSPLESGPSYDLGRMTAFLNKWAAAPAK